MGCPCKIVIGDLYKSSDMQQPFFFVWAEFFIDYTKPNKDGKELKDVFIAEDFGFYDVDTKTYVRNDCKGNELKFCLPNELLTWLREYAQTTSYYRTDALRAYLESLPEELTYFYNELERNVLCFYYEY